MKAFIIAAITADGFIGRHSTELADWSSKEDKRLFVELTKRAGVMIMGGNTYRTIGRPLPGRRTIVYSRTPIEHDGVETTQSPPAQLLRQLEKEGCQEVAICGGRSIYDAFLQAGVVNELYLTVEPLLFGTGLTLASDSLSASLRLLEHRALNDNTILLHYEVQP